MELCVFFGWLIFSAWNAKCPIFLGNFTPKTSNYCLKNRVLGFPGGDFLFPLLQEMGSDPTEVVKLMKES